KTEISQPAQSLSLTTINFNWPWTYCKLRDWDRDREVDRIPLCVNDWGLPQDCAIPWLETALRRGGGECTPSVSVVNFQAMRESSASVCQANVCFYPADIPIRSPHETPHPRPAARVVRYRLRLERQPQRNFPAFLQWDGLCRRLSDDHTGSRSSHPHVQESLEPRQWHNSV